MQRRKVARYRWQTNDDPCHECLPQPQDLSQQRAAAVASELQLHPGPDPVGLTMTTGTDPAPDTTGTGPSSPADGPNSPAGSPTAGDGDQQAQDTTTKDEPQTFSREYVQRLRDEAVSHRVKTRRRWPMPSKTSL